ncbi:MAG TPA: M66 family metalloprotease, partial [Pirellulaceae bacterium]
MWPGEKVLDGKRENACEILVAVRKYQIAGCLGNPLSVLTSPRATPFGPTYFVSVRGTVMKASQRPRRTQSHQILLRAESLEERRLLSASVNRPIGIAALDTSDPTAGFVDGDRQPPLTSAEVFNLQSKPDSNFTIYLDFDGHVTTGTDWNFYFEVDTIVSPAFDLDGDATTFGAMELQRILLSWQRTAEDFAPFDVNVTTRDPGIDALINSGAGDTKWGNRSVVSVDNFADCGCGGFAFLESFGDPLGAPSFVFNKGEDSLGETFSHEVGHTLGLFHDGLNNGGQEYYGGHGSGALGWGPIMGAPFTRNITQWDRGEYFDSSNQFDIDLDIITTLNGFGYRVDDYGNTRPTAGNLTVSNLTNVDAFGIIERNTDIDYFKFETGGGNVSFNI